MHTRMDYYMISSKEENKIPEGNLLELGKRLKIFVNVYIKHIYIKDPNHLIILRQIDHIADLILTKQYYQLFDNPLQIIEPLTEQDYYDDDVPF